MRGWQVPAAFYWPVRPAEEQLPAGRRLPVFSMQGALAEPLAGWLLVVAHPQIERMAISTPAARVRVIMRNSPLELKKGR
jgi:hypothetical protein